MSEQYAVDIEEVDYLTHGDKHFAARVFRPRGKGPFPAMVEAHGGAWCNGDRTNNDAVNQAVAAGGVVVAALDFRSPPDATYPGSVADVNYGVRWLKSQAARFDTKPEWVGSMGTSSGGHLAVLNALKPLDPRYAGISLAGANFDARVAYVVALWPVICPWGRYRNEAAKVSGDAAYRNRGGAIALQLRYWLNEDTMAEGSPTQALERGDAVEMPPILYLQNPADLLHPRANLEQFVAQYRKRGGEVQLEFFEGPSYDLVRTDPTSESAKGAVAKIVAFIHRQVGT